MLQNIELYLKPANEPYTRAEILQILEISDENLSSASLNKNALNSKIKNLIIIKKNFV